MARTVSSQGQLVTSLGEGERKHVSLSPTILTQHIVHSTVDNLYSLSQDIVKEADNECKD